MTRGGDPWLTPDELRAWRAYVEAAQRLFERLERELQRDAALSNADYELLVRLSETEGRRMRMSELAGETLFSRSRLSHAVARLEQLGWIRRESCPSDRRGVFAVLTDEGFAVLAGAAPRHARAVRRYLFDNLDPGQVEELERLSRAIGDALEAGGPEEPGTNGGPPARGRRPGW